MALRAMAAAFQRTRFAFWHKIENHTIKFLWVILVKTYITFTRKGLLALLAAAVAMILICGEIYAAGNTDTDAATNAERITFIKNAGYTVLSTEPQTKTVTIPETFSDVYKNYNDIQRAAGYDLSLYKGCEVTIYTYNIQTPDGYSGESVCNMIVYNDRIIGGDVSSAALGGFMLPIKNQ